MSLLALGDKPPYKVCGKKASSAYFFLCEHAGKAFPKKLKKLGLTPEQLSTDVVWDKGAEAVIVNLCSMLKTQGIAGNYSRLLIDLNRNFDHPMYIADVSQRGFIVPGNQKLSLLDIQQREQEIFWPFHNKAERLLAKMKQDRKANPVVLSIHSFAPEYDGVKRPWHIGILWNKDDRVAKPLITALQKDRDVIVGENQPYSGQGERGLLFSIPYHAEIKHWPHVVIEIRNDLISDAKGVLKWSKILAKALQEIETII